MRWLLPLGERGVVADGVADVGLARPGDAGALLELLLVMASQPAVRGMAKSTVNMFIGKPMAW